ncbi:MAG: hypothetical protein HYT80_10750 [Euryarchaeota archaeon]|nr:hypothetical protein [Euryarchaeota archaeon]
MADDGNAAMHVPEISMAIIGQTDDDPVGHCQPLVASSEAVKAPALRMAAPKTVGTASQSRAKYTHATTLTAWMATPGSVQRRAAPTLK